MVVVRPRRPPARDHKEIAAWEASCSRSQGDSGLGGLLLEITRRSQAKRSLARPAGRRAAMNHTASIHGRPARCNEPHSFDPRGTADRRAAMDHTASIPGERPTGAQQWTTQLRSPGKVTSSHRLLSCRRPARSEGEKRRRSNRRRVRGKSGSHTPRGNLPRRRPAGAYPQPGPIHTRGL